MARFRVLVAMVASAVILFATAQSGRSDGKPAESASKLSYKVYALNELGVDGEVGKWIATTLPKVVEPATWNQGLSGQGVLSHQPTANLLVVYQTADVHAKVDAFLASVKQKTAPKQQAVVTPTGTAPPSGFVGVDSLRPPPPTVVVGVPACAPASVPTPPPTSAVKPAPAVKWQELASAISKWQEATAKTASAEPAAPVPAPIDSTRPRHKIVFVYEGEGIIDSNVVAWTKAYMASDSVLATGLTELMKALAAEITKEKEKEKDTNVVPAAEAQGTKSATPAVPAVPGGAPVIAYSKPAPRGSAVKEIANPATGDPLLSQLAARRATWWKAESTADGVTFSCIVPDRQNPEINRQYEVTAADYAAAVRAMLAKLDEQK